MIRLTQQRKKDGPVVVVEADDDCAAPELADAFRAFMLAIGYHPDTVSEVFEEE